ncbi:hypothetical protein D3C72_1809410 [compost metagenome]
MAQRQRFGEFEHLVDAAARLDRPGDGQAVIGLDPQRAVPRGQPERLLHARRAQQVRFDPPRAGFQFREQPRQQRREAGEPRLRRTHIS